VSRWECGVCWHVYDPAQGDPVAQVAPGTAFEALPADWRCPHCDSARERYLEMHEVDARVSALVAEYRTIAETRMKGLPILNLRLSVEAVDFQETPAGLLGALVTPWFINAVLFPATPVKVPDHGHERTLPGGAFHFLGQVLDTVGSIELCSLHSPVLDFADQAAAVAAARAGLQPMLAPPAVVAGADEAEAALKQGPSRRDLFRIFRGGGS
jgi:[NiFe] hydrogenase assembly HybE family chaperone